MNNNRKMSAPSPVLLEELRVVAGCDYISQLPEPPYGQTALSWLSKFEIEAYSLAEWSDTIAYLLKAKYPFSSHQDVATFLSAATEKWPALSLSFDPI